MAWYDFITDIDWGGVVQRAVPAVITGYMTQRGNLGAAEQYAQSQGESARLIAESNRRAAEIAEEGARRAESRYGPIAERGIPALDYLGRTVADRGITPAQQQRIMDARRETANQLSSRLGGRSATAIASRTAGNLENQIYEANRARSDAAANQLAGLGVTATGALASGDVNLANVLAKSQQNVGTAGAEAARNIGNSAADTTLANTGVTGQVVGDIMGVDRSTQDLLDIIRSTSAQERKSARAGQELGI